MENLKPLINDLQSIFDINFALTTSQIRALQQAAALIRKVDKGDLVEVVHAYRIDLGHDEMCSNCGSLEVPYGLQYCPNCGAKMDGERKDDHKADERDKLSEFM